MKPLRCTIGKTDGKGYRFYYCSTCKAIGSLYGHKMRFFLNHDIAFFAEILTDLDDNMPREKQWNQTTHRSKCFKLPRKSGNIPFAYTIASAINIILAKFTIDNKIQDGKGKRIFLKLIRSLIQPQYAEATKKLESFSFPIHRISSLAAQQSSKENHSRITGYGNKALDYFSQPTAIITGIVFQYASHLIGKSQFMHHMYTVGYNLGKIVYILDAWEDFKKDFDKGNFNAIATAFHIRDGEIDKPTINQVFETLRISKIKIIKRLHGLPLSKEKMHLFSKRLEINLHQRLKSHSPAPGFIPSLRCDIPESKKYQQLIPVPVGIPPHSIKFQTKAKRYLNASLFVLTLPIQFGFRKRVPRDEAPETKRARRQNERSECCCCCCDMSDCCCTCLICDFCSDCDCDCCDCCDCDC